MNHDPAEHAAPPPPERVLPQPAAEDPPSEDVWPEEPSESAIQDTWATERDDPGGGWEGPEQNEDADEPTWSEDGPAGQGVEFADEPDPEVPSQEDPWEVEAPLPSPQVRP